MTCGVGIIGAGPGVAALHLPDARAPRRATSRSSTVGCRQRPGRRPRRARCGARASEGIDDLLADPDVEIVAICSPPGEHAEQILASVAAGKRAILCEKPVGTTIAEAERAVEACRDAGIPLIVGTNHYYDPAWGRAKHYLTATGGPVVSISVTLALPPNTRYHDVVTEIGAPAGQPPRSGPPPPRSRRRSGEGAAHGPRDPRPAARARSRAAVRARRVRPGGRTDRLRRRASSRAASRSSSRPSCSPRAPTRCGD